MHSTSLAPLLSATRSLVSCWIMRSPSSFEDFDEAPTLHLRQRPRLLHADAVADVEVVGFVVDVQLLAALQRLPVQRMAHAVDDRHHRGLVHPCGNHDALTRLAGIRAVSHSTPPK